MSIRFRLSTLLLLLLAAPVAHAQSGSLLPDEGQLNRLGLTLAWWGQAVVDATSDHVEFLTADEQSVYVQTDRGLISAFHGELGRRNWSQLMGMPDQQSFPLSTNDEEVLISVGMHIYSLNKVNGEMLWMNRVQVHPSASPAVDDSQIYIGTVDGNVYSYDLKMVRRLFEQGMLPRWGEQARLWRFQTPAEIVSPPIVSGTTVSFASQKGIVYGVTVREKQLKFKFESDGKILAPLGRYKNFIYIADTQSRMYCINQSNGQLRWIFTSGSPIRTRPLGVGSHVFVVPYREGLAAVSDSTGRADWQQPRAIEFVAASNTRVYATDDSRNLLVINRANGQILGSVALPQFEIVVNNDRTDRIVLATRKGTLISLREIGSEYPVYHLYPERRPILPEFAEELPVPPEPMLDE